MTSFCLLWVCTANSLKPCCFAGVPAFRGLPGASSFSYPNPLSGPQESQQDY